MTDRAPVPVPAEVLRRARPIPTYRDHPATVGHDLVGVDPSGASRSVRIRGGAEAVCVLFLSSSCQGCLDLWEGMGELGRTLGPEVRVVAVTLTWRPRDGGRGAVGGVGWPGGRPRW